MTALLIYIVIGAFAGLMSGMIGLGGGTIVVPALALIFSMQGIPHEVIMRMAIATSLAVMIVTTFSSMI